MRKQKREGVIGLVLREQTESRQRTNGQTPAIARIVLEVVNREKFVALGKVVIESQGREVSSEQARNVSDKASQPAVGRTERSRGIRVRVITVGDIQGDGIEQARRNAEPAARAAGDDRV